MIEQTVYLPERLHRKLAALGDVNGQTPQEYIVTALAEHVRVTPAPINLYRVLWSWHSGPGRGAFTDNVHLTAGYTDEGDIPRILATKYGYDGETGEDVAIISVTHLGRVQ